MVNPVPGYKITTPFGKKGSAWATGVHGGDDWAAPRGTKVVAPWGGTVSGVRTGSSNSGTTWGSAYGNQVVIDFDRLPDGSAGLWGVLAHLSKVSVKVGQRVEAGQKIGEVGSTGNSTGNHLHFEVQPQKNWVRGSYRDPERWVNAASSTPPAPSNGPYVTSHIYTSKLGFGEPTNGDADSNTVKELQERLNRISLPNGVTLPVTGRYLEMTDAEVRKWQEHVCEDVPDPAKKSYLGPRQVAKMFPSGIYTIHDDGLPKIAGGTTPPVPPVEPEPEYDFQPKDGTTLGKWLDSQGFDVVDTDVSIGRASTWLGPRFVMWHHTASPNTNTPESDARWIRRGNDDAPLAQIMVDQQGRVWLCSYERSGQKDPGRASHAGSGKGFGVPDDKMNEVSIGIEFKCPGDKPISAYPQMYEVGLRLTTALCQRHSIPASNVIGHKEWSDTGKKDPLDDMDRIRTEIQDLLDPEPEEPVVPPVTPRAKYVYTGKPSGSQDVGTSYAQVTNGNFTPPGKGLLFSMVYLNLAHGFDSGINEAGVRVRAVRDPDDMTAYQDFLLGRHLTKPGEFLITHLWFEICDANRKVWWEVDRAAEFSRMSAGTRYTKWLWVSFDALFGPVTSRVSTDQMLALVDAFLTEPEGEDPVELVIW